jgi:hypothetical protein
LYFAMCVKVFKIGWYAPNNAHRCSIGPAINQLILPVLPIGQLLKLPSQQIRQYLQKYIMGPITFFTKFNITCSHALLYDTATIYRYRVLIAVIKVNDTAFYFILLPSTRALPAYRYCQRMALVAQGLLRYWQYRFLLPQAAQAYPIAAMLLPHFCT